MKKKGFTLLELLIVIIILGILAAIAMPRYFANIEKAREAEARASLNSIRQAELAYYATKGVYTTLPISVDVDGDGTTDIDLATPQSASFTFSADTVNKYGKATKAAAKKDYYMCFANGLFTIDAAPIPACP